MNHVFTCEIVLYDTPWNIRFLSHNRINEKSFSYSTDIELQSFFSFPEMHME